MKDYYLEDLMCCVLKGHTPEDFTYDDLNEEYYIEVFGNTYYTQGVWNKAQLNDKLEHFDSLLVYGSDSSTIAFINKIQ